MLGGTIIRGFTMFRLNFTCLFWLLLSTTSLASENNATDQQLSVTESEYQIEGWRETLVSVRNFSDYDIFFDEVAQWELRDKGVVSKQQLKAWQLPESASATYRLYANKGAKSGFIRLLQFNGVEQRYIRQDSQSWDTGGIFDINVRVIDMEGVAEKLRALGWKARAPITRFVFGPYDVKEWIVASPDGLEIALISRISPTLEGWPNLKAISRTFNSTQVVRDFDQAIDFYHEVLGFKMVQQEHGYLSKEPGPNSLGFPYNVQTVNPRKVFIMSPSGKNEGSVEILKILGIDGADHSPHSNLPNLGIAALRFPVSNIAEFNQYLKKQQVDWVHELQSVDGRQSLIIKSPEGAWLEFHENRNQ